MMIIMARKNETTSTETIANPTVTLTQEALQRLLSEAAGEALDRQRTELKAAYEAVAAKAQAQNTVAAMSGKSERSAANELAVVRAFKKAGYGIVTPRINVKTFRRWVEEDGRRVVEGCKSTKVRRLRLFHISQTRSLEAEELEAIKEQKSASVARQEASKVIPIHTPQ